MSEEKTRKLPVKRFCLIKLLIYLVTSLKRLILTGNFREFNHYLWNGLFNRSF